MADKKTLRQVFIQAANEVVTAPYTDEQVAEARQNYLHSKYYATSAWTQWKDLPKSTRLEHIDAIAAIRPMFCAPSCEATCECGAAIPAAYIVSDPPSETFPWINVNGVRYVPEVQHHPGVRWAYDDPVTGETCYRDEPIHCAGAYVVADDRREDDPDADRAKELGAQRDRAWRASRKCERLVMDCRESVTRAINEMLEGEDIDLWRDVVGEELPKE